MKTGGGSRIALNKATWDVWSKRCVIQDEDNAFAKGSVLIGLDTQSNPICIRLKDVSAVQFTVMQQPLKITVEEKNPLNRADYYDNPCS